MVRTAPRFNARRSLAVSIALAAVAAAIVVAPARAQQGIGGFAGSNPEEFALTGLVTLRWGSYAYQPQFPLALLYDDDYNSGGVNASIFGPAVLSPMLLLYPFLHTRTETPLRKVAMAYVGLASIANSQHHLVVHETATGQWSRRTTSLFIGPRTDYYMFQNTDWFRVAVAGGLRVTAWENLKPEARYDQGVGFQLGVEFPWDVVDGEWSDGDPLAFVGVVWWHR